MNYFFYAEKIAAANIFQMPFLAELILGLLIGVSSRLAFISRKKSFYTLLVTAAVTWLICEVVYCFIFKMNNIAVFGLGQFCFVLSPILFCAVIGTLLSHLVCIAVNRKKLK